MQKKIKIVHIISSLKRGGAEALLCDLIGGMDERFENHVIYFHAGPNVARLAPIAASMHHITGAFSLYDPVFFTRLYKTVKALQPDCIHSSLWSANIAARVIARLLHIPLMTALHNNVDQNGFVRNLLDVHTQSFGDSIIAVSDGIVQSLLERDAVVPARLTVIKNGIDVRAVQSNARAMMCTRRSIGLHEDQFVIGSVGRFVPLKNYPLLLNAFSSVVRVHCHARLVLVGTGPDETALRAQAQELGIADKVIFVVGQSAYGYYPLFDCFVLSSFKEGISMALLEAMSCALPCIVTHSGGVHDVIQHGINGMLVPLDQTALSAQLNAFITDATLRSSLGTNARALVEQQFCLSAMVHAYQDKYIQIATRNSKK